ncbi:uncharacterized protein F4812DRAFT_464603 [Daldinia caldariorum]|uniref:uncharacterized protein n=1 Tax=Daldinia caldariorum TaxID=326644 RepID=UPI002007C566|nr:uncharacterized protein F4812DRAFT_464603 [Daldinia caldariorum]KAI1472482.1 hypothetical protein F4812DRAFT_464603 [Daldinia caldariorum]
MTDMILPKGIVLNRNDVYEEIAKYDVVPLNQILAACHVFTTTSRELFDPTARRLENFWTRVLGGDRRYLPGTVIARLFKSISEEESFVKLRGPPNRYEPPSPDSKVDLPSKVEAKSETPGKGSSESALKDKAEAMKSAPSSAVKRPHPILKKPRGPSHSGPRPTARFVSPPGSDGEGNDSKDSELASSGSTVVNHSGDSKRSTSSTAKEEKRKATHSTPKKKTTAFVASTASRRRPAMPRRISSQSSAPVSVAEAGSREGGFSLGSKQSGSHSSATIVPEKSGKGPSSTVKQENEQLSEKAAGKRPATFLRDLPYTSKPSSSQTGTTDNQRLIVQDERADATKLNFTADNTSSAFPEEATTMRASRSGSVHRRSDTQEQQRPDTLPLMSRSRSDVGSTRRSSYDLVSGLAPPRSLISSSTTTISNTTAQGTIIEFDENPLLSEIAISAMQGREEDTESSSRRSSSSVLDSRFTPTLPNPAPPVPLGRSKSQLTLLLERKGEKKPRR